MRTNKFFCLFGILSSFWSASIFAVDCNEESRGFQLQGEAYFNVDNPIQLNSRDRKQVQDFYKSIKGDWQGESVFTDCRGSSRAMKVHSKKYDMETGVEIGRDNTIRFQTEKRDGNKKTIDVAYYFDEENLS